MDVLSIQAVDALTHAIDRDSKATARQNQILIALGVVGAGLAVAGVIEGALALVS